ncbi:MAG: T9SS type A sorting domain-containing protein, partial [Bacteroidia bacterium]|nr:T9SS type A sorting domain-containing protein [Bacteroidia bacterium]
GLNFKQGEDVTLSIWNLDGRILQKRSLGWIQNQIIPINLSNFAPGMYLLKIETPKGVTGRKIIKQ